MNTNLAENDLAKIVVDVVHHIHRQLGPGLLESGYQAVMVYELRKRGLHVDSRLPVPIFWEDMRLEKGFEADIVVDGRLIVELKSVENVAPVYKKQLLTYLRLMNCRLGLLINFGAELIRDGLFRIVNGLEG